MFKAKTLVGLHDFGKGMRPASSPKRKPLGQLKRTVEPPIVKEEGPEVDSEDEAWPVRISNITASFVAKDQFWTTTGMYPQLVVVTFECTTRLLELQVICCAAIQAMRVSSLGSRGWEDVATMAFDDGGGDFHRRILEFRSQRLISQKLCLCIERAATDFSTVKSLEVLGVAA